MNVLVPYKLSISSRIIKYQIIVVFIFNLKKNHLCGDQIKKWHILLYATTKTTYSNVYILIFMTYILYIYISVKYKSEIKSDINLNIYL